MTQKHVIPLGALVEVSPDGLDIPNGIRLFVGCHSYDFDGTALYDLVFDKEYIGLTLEQHNSGITDAGLIAAFTSMFHAKFDKGYTVESLKIIKFRE